MRYSPPFWYIGEGDRETLDQIDNRKADFLWGGLGAPKQEKWMFLHKGKVN